MEEGHRRGRRQGQPRSRRRREGERRFDTVVLHQRPQVPRPTDLRGDEGLDRRGAQQVKRATVVAMLLAAVALSSLAYAGVGKGQRAPEFALGSLKGQKVALSELRGKVV